MLGYFYIDDPQIGFMDQCRGLKCLSGLLICKFGRGQFAEFVVHQWQEPTLLHSSRQIQFETRFV